MLRRVGKYLGSPRFMATFGLLAVGLIGVQGCGGSTATQSTPDSTSSRVPAQASGGLAGGVPPLLDPANVYAADGVGRFSPVVRGFRPLIYVPNSASATVQEIDPTTYRVIRKFSVGAVPQHVVPSYDLRTLWVTNDIGDSLTPINPVNGLPGPTVPVTDPYNMYYTPDGRYAAVMAERLRRVDFRDAHTMKIHHSLSVPGCAGLNHADYTSDGRLMLVSCEFAARMAVLDVQAQRVVRMVQLRSGASPQDVKLSPDGRVFYVADLVHGGLSEIDAATFARIGFLPTGAGAHGLYPSRDATRMYVSNRSAGTISVVDFASRRVVARWAIPGSSPDMGGVSASGHVLWLSGRYSGEVYAINASTGKLIRRIPVGSGPHGLCVYPQPGRYSLGHTGILR